MKIKPLPGKVFVTNMERGERKSRGGIVITNDNMKEHGIRPRWAEVYTVGKEITDIKPGMWVLLEHGRWSFGFDMDIDGSGEKTTIWLADYPEGVLLVSDTKPENV